MLRGALRFLSSEVRGLQAAVYILALSALLSSILALARDRLFASHFGAGAELDIYYAAFRIPDLIFVATGALVSVYVLIPELARRGEREQKSYIDTILLGFSLFAVVVSGVAALFAPHVLALLFPRFAAEGQLVQVTALTRIMLLQPILLGISNILAAITQTKHRYALYSVSPLLYNAGIILGLLVLYPVLGLPGLAWGVVFGAALHAGVQLPSIVRDGFLIHFPRLREPRALFSTALVSIPRALTLSMNQVIFLGLTSLASGLATGSIAVFMFAYNLQAVPLSIIGASYSVAAFPTLAAALSRGERAEFVAHIVTAARYVLFWSLPASALILVLRAHMVRVVLGAGQFDWTDTRLTAAAFALMALSLAAQGLMLLLARGYYAAGRTFVPFFVALASAFGTIALARVLLESFKDPSVLFYVQSMLRLEDVPGSTLLALPLAFAIVSIIGLVALSLHFERRFGGFYAGIRETLWQSATAALAGGTATYILLALVGPLTFASALFTVFLRGSLAGIAGLAATVLVYALLGNRELGETFAGIHARLWRTKLAPGDAALSAEEMSATSPQ